MNAIRTSLSRAPGEATSEQELEAMRQRAWLEQQVITIRLGEIADDWLRAGMVQLATKRWGKRLNGKA